MNETDEALYSRYLETDDDGDLEILLARHREGLLLFLLGFVRNPEDAENLLMDTFARLAADQPRFEASYPGSFRNWLYTIRRRNALMQLRKGKLRTEPLREDAQAETDLPEITLLKEERNRNIVQISPDDLTRFRNGTDSVQMSYFFNSMSSPSRSRIASPTPSRFASLASLCS